ncbi:acetolactate synthase small subunit [Weeksellaceae bacterium TAE3-ERU29]|nr:acetolactate synthase small subunit [Weeksellaceae bacterium TAE3-ERU29]
MEEKIYNVSVYTENRIGILSRISGIFTKCQVNIEDISASNTEIDGVTRIIIVSKTTEKWIKTIVKKIDKQVEVIKAYYHTDDEIVYLENSLFKLATATLFDNNEIQEIIREHNAEIVMVYKDFFVLSKSGDRESINQMYSRLKPFGIMQFVRSARIAVSKEEMKVSDILKEKDFEEKI